MAIIKEFKYGEGLITICDDYRVKTEEERHQIIQNVSRLIVNNLEKQGLLEQIVYGDKKKADEDGEDCGQQA